MLGELFGNKNIEKVLFYLLINGKCYAGKLARHFKSPLTPIQQALIKLEQIGIVESFTEGKIRYYQFNQICPYLEELETLLRKTFTLLSSTEKKEYYDAEFKPQKVNKKKYHENNLVLNIWNRLPSTGHLSFTSQSQKQGMTDLMGIGKGDVRVRKINDHALIFEEKGTWVSKEHQEFKFTNVFKWIFDPFQNNITLEHLRLGEKNPVFLFRLVQVDEQTLQSISSYVCKEDTYLGQVRCDEHSIKLNWRVIGPKKNDEINYLYF
jgi:hypothetical protein